MDIKISVVRPKGNVTISFKTEMNRNTMPEIQPATGYGVCSSAQWSLRPYKVR